MDRRVLKESYEIFGSYVILNLSFSKSFFFFKYKSFKNTFKIIFICMGVPVV